ncbi:universal stress protein [Roseobacter weihaiensis]|uniref:universal stress protein n=1 Tax=Roseobacter weihaiensis TaxID=2763262 RepID=UPI001D09A052|nr:universal stress protein [Roseobacter sp. H9]
MTTKLLVGLDGHSSGERALAYGEGLAKLIGSCSLLVVYVIEWSPYSFQTAEENAQRHKRREEEIATAMSRVISPALETLKSKGIDAEGIVRHGNVADTLDALASSEKADQIIVGRAAESGLSQRIFGSSTANLVMQARVPVTVVG